MIGHNLITGIVPEHLQHSLLGPRQTCGLDYYEVRLSWLHRGLMRPVIQRSAAVRTLQRTKSVETKMQDTSLG